MPSMLMVLTVSAMYGIIGVAALLFNGIVIYLYMRYLAFLFNWYSLQLKNGNIIYFGFSKILLLYCVTNVTNSQEDFQMRNVVFIYQISSIASYVIIGTRVWENQSIWLWCISVWQEWWWWAKFQYFLSTCSIRNHSPESLEPRYWVSQYKASWKTRKF